MYVIIHACLAPFIAPPDMTNRLPLHSHFRPALFPANHPDTAMRSPDLKAAADFDRNMTRTRSNLASALLVVLLMLVASVQPEGVCVRTWTACMHACIHRMHAGSACGCLADDLRACAYWLCAIRTAYQARETRTKDDSAKARLGDNDVHSSYVCTSEPIRHLCIVRRRS